jgi:DNA-binding CsgD family transcriptional regulator
MSKISLNPEELSDLIGLVYDSALEPDQWRSLRDRICEMFPGYVSLTATFDGLRVVGSYSPTGFITPEAEHHYESLGSQGHIRGDVYDGVDLSTVKRLNSSESLGNVANSRDWYGDAGYRETPAYRMFFGPAGYGHWTSLCFAVNGSRTAVLSFVEAGLDDVTKDEKGLKRVLALISPHVVRGARVARALYMAKEAAETYKGFLDGIALPLVIVDRDGNLQMANAAGQKMIERGTFVRHASSGQVSLIDELGQDMFLRALRDSDFANDPCGLIVDDGDDPVSICVVPFHPVMMTDLKTEQDMFDRSQLYAVFFGTKGQATINKALLQDVFGLTLREADICRALAAGQSPVQIAELQGRAEKTIRNQIQSVHEKVGVTSTRELAEALSVFRTVGAMFDGNDPHLFGQQKLSSQ